MSRSVPSYRKHKASGQAVVTLNGVDHYLGRFNSPESKVEYDRLTGEWLARGRQLASRRDGEPPKDWMVKELIHGFYTHCTGPLSEGPLEQVKYALRPVRELYGDAPAADFGPVAFKAVRQKMVDSGWGLGTIRNRL